MEEDKRGADTEVQAGADGNSAETERGGGGEREVDAVGLQGGWDSYSDVLLVVEGIGRSVLHSPAFAPEFAAQGASYSRAAPAAARLISPPHGGREADAKVS